MSNRGPLAWTTTVLRSLKDDRSVRADVREQRLSGGLFSWRGVSNTRYTTRQKARDVLPVGAVVLAVVRNEVGLASLVAVAAFEGDAAEFVAFRARAHAAGATELQIHTLSESAAARAAMVADLAPGARVAAPAPTAALVRDGAYDRRAIMAAACTAAKARQVATGEAWAICIGPALKAAWIQARAARAAAQH